MKDNLHNPAKGANASVLALHSYASSKTDQGTYMHYIKMETNYEHLNYGVVELSRQRASVQSELSKKDATIESLKRSLAENVTKIKHHSSAVRDALEQNQGYKSSMVHEKVEELLGSLESLSLLQSDGT